MKNKIINVLCILMGLLFINGGLNKIFKYIPTPDDLPENLQKLNDAFETIGWLMPLVAVVELAGGILFAIPKTRALGAMVLFPVMTGILLVHIFNAPEGLPMAIILMGLNLFILYENRDRYMAMLR
ncbi:MAG: DoxX family protein [Bacteroidetes bacterium]|nr:DoxX family protein [Bacteroidota bacterium]